ncbi:receptor-type tyrosine-protein phosphatase T-like isoform X2 [Haliotis rubra]|uniref:receptor-type tyrosine-protein phosphatase T-like isoform X2 n=1 Tax=Haliotis rubra TaxID=36100 RepID=UPI001EE51631|nr:receptor-type tyrosine-protein phosphatase T-like isoform X2 [Haliotis rubra]
MYYNIGVAPAATVVSVDQLGERIKELQVPVGGFQAEFQKLPTTFTRPYNDSQLEENKGKNKYISYYPYDATRVVLQELPDQPGSDYINASYINGYSQPKAYIAAQAPNRMTLTDFWRMIWEQNCTRIVMLTNLKELGRVKCVAYWSDTTDMNTGDFIISVTDSSIRANWVVRELQVTDRQTNTRRCFNQFHFTTWPDHGTPEEMALTEFLWLVRTSRTTQDDPLLVHCSAGIGRTGTYIALDYLLDQALAEDAVDVFGCVSGMRDQRKGMIQTKEQYTCLYTALHETLQVGNTAISLEEFRSNRNVKGTFSTGRMSITRFIETLNTQRKEQSNETSVKGQVWINGRSDILSIRLQSHLSMNGYLLTEAPSVTTASLFWKLTEEQESSTVIVPPDSHQSLSSFVPSPGDSLDLDPVTVRCSTEIPVNTDITLLNIHRQMENSQPTHVRVYILNNLPAQSPSAFLELLEELDRHAGRRQSQHCHCYVQRWRQAERSNVMHPEQYCPRPEV